MGATIANRVVRVDFLKPQELAEHPENWREHGATQIAALRGVLGSIGIAGALVAYYSERHGGALTLIDGHGRRREAGGQPWPVLITDLTDQEADALLAVYDPLGAMAGANKAQHAALAQRAAGESEEGDPLRTLLQRLADDASGTRRKPPKAQEAGPVGNPQITLTLPQDIYPLWLQAVQRYGTPTEALVALIQADGPYDPA